MERPGGVSVIAIVFGVAAVSLFALGALVLVSPELEAIRICTLLLLGLVRAGAYVLFVCGAIATLISSGLWRTRNWARRLSIVIAVVGIVLLAPGVSTPRLRSIFVLSAVGLMLRVMIIWYLWRDDVRQSFRRRKENA